MIEDSKEWVSPRLKIRFVHTQDALQVLYPNGKPFLSSIELSERLEHSEVRAEKAEIRAEQEATRAEQEAARAKQEAARADQEAINSRRLAEKLRSLGIDPDKG